MRLPIMFCRCTIMVDGVDAVKVEVLDEAGFRG